MLKDELVVKIFSTEKLIKHKLRSKNKWSDHNFLFETSAEIIIERLDSIKKNFSKIYYYNNGETSIIEDYLSKRYGIDSYKILSLHENINQKSDLIIDPEKSKIMENEVDLFICNLNLHWINDLPGFLYRIKKSLKENGLFLGSALGGKTLQELRRSIFLMQDQLNIGFTNHISPFMDSQDAANLLKRAKFSSQISDSEGIELAYDNIYDLFSDLRNIGETNCLADSSRFFTQKMLDNLEFHYSQNFLDQEKKYKANFEMIFLSGMNI